MASITSPRQQSLLTYLLIHRDDPQTRRTIAAQLWPSSSDKQALTNLRRELYHLRRSLPDAERFIDIQQQTAGWRADSSYRLDVQDFEAEISRAQAALEQGQSDRAREALRKSLAIYKGPLVPDNYEEWILRYSEELQHQYIRVLERLFELASSDDDYSAAAHYAERLLRSDPLQESWYRNLINLHVAHGNRAEALRVYNLCVETLRHELDVEPGPQTQKLYQSLLAREQTRIRSHGFPSQTTRFIGREREIVELVKLLQDEDCRLLTLLGPGGIGKTRLAIQAALSAAEEYAGIFEHGIYYVSLVSVESSDLLLSTIAEAIGLAFQEGGDPRAQLFNYLAEKSLLLLLDNFEHLQPGRELILQISRQAPQVKLLVTSRERLNLKQEWIYEVRGLGVLEGSQGSENDFRSAVELFYISASRIHIELVELENSYPEVARICRLVDGNPLAIELAASWADKLSLEEIALEIETGLDFLSTSKIDIPERHQSMRAVFEHSWNLLSPEERKILRRLAVFQGRFDRPAALEIAGGTLRVLSSLVDKSMLQWRPDGYYEMHRLLRQFAAEKLAAHQNEREKLSGRFRDYFLDFLHQQGANLRGSEPHKALQSISVVIDQIRTSWNLAIETGQFLSLDKSAQPLYLFYDLRGWFQEGADQFAAAADYLQLSIEKQAADRAELRALYWRLRMFQASMQYHLGRYDQAQQMLEECSRGLDERSRGEEKAQAMLRLGQIAFRRGEHQAARAHLEKSLEIFRGTPNLWETATALSFLGDVMRSLGEYNLAKTYLYESLAMRKDIGYPARVADSLNTLGIVHSAMGDYPQGLGSFQESLAIRRSLGDPWGVAKTLNNLAILTTWMGDLAQAREYHEESLALRREIGNPFGIAIALHNLGDLAYRLGDLPEAEARFHEALLIRRRINTKEGIANTLRMLALIALDGGDEPGARRSFEEALQIAVAIQAVPTILAISAGIAGLLVHRGQNRLAVEVLTFVVSHPGVESDLRERAESQLLQLQEQQGAEGGDLPADEMFAGDLDKLTDRLLATL